MFVVFPFLIYDTSNEFFVLANKKCKDKIYSLVVIDCHINIMLNTVNII